jgi:hypothetical protein
MARILASRSPNQARQRPGIQATSFGRRGVAPLPLFGNFSYSAVFLTNFSLTNHYPRRETKEERDLGRPKPVAAAASARRSDTTTVSIIRNMKRGEYTIMRSN